MIYLIGGAPRAGKSILVQSISAKRNVSWISTDLLIESAGTHGQTHYTDIPDPEAIQSLIYQAREDRQHSLQSGSQAAPESSASQLATLSRLHDEGKLSDSEFEAENQKLIGGA